MPREPKVLWQEHPGGILASGGCLGQGASCEPGCLEVLPGVQVGSGGTGGCCSPHDQRPFYAFPPPSLPSQGKGEAPHGEMQLVW